MNYDSSRAGKARVRVVVGQRLRCRLWHDFRIVGSFQSECFQISRWTTTLDRLLPNSLTSNLVSMLSNSLVGIIAWASCCQVAWLDL